MQERLDRLESLLTQSYERLARIEATLEAWTTNIERFWGQAMPKLEHDISGLNSRLIAVEGEIAGLKGKVAIISAGIGAAIAGGFSIVRHLLGD